MRSKLICQLLKVSEKLFGHVTGVFQVNVKVPIQLRGVRRRKVEREVPFIEVLWDRCRAAVLSLPQLDVAIDPARLRALLLVRVLPRIPDPGQRVDHKLARVELEVDGLMPEGDLGLRVVLLDQLADLGKKRIEVRLRRVVSPSSPHPDKEATHGQNAE